MKILKLLIILFIPAISTFAQIYSTSEGGVWSDTLTWVGHKLPTAVDDVVIVGTVKPNSSYNTLECNNLTVNSGASLYCDNYGSYGASVNIHGDFTNNGTVSQSDLYWAFGLRVYKNVINNGTIQISYIRLMSTEKQYISGNSNLNPENITVETKHDIELSSNVSIVDCHLNLEGSNVIIPSGIKFKLLGLAESNNIEALDKANVYGGGTLYMTNGYYFSDSSSVENLTLEGTIMVRSDFKILSNVTLLDTLTHKPDNYSVTIDIIEDFTNNGIIFRNPDDNDGFNIKIHKNFFNEGSIYDIIFFFVSNTAQTIGGSKPIEYCGFEIENGQDIVVEDNMEFKEDYFKFNNSRFIINEGKEISLIGNDYQYRGHISQAYLTGGGTIKFSNGFTIEDTTRLQNINLKGLIEFDDVSLFYDKVTLNDTVQPHNGFGYAPDLYFKENFTNNALIKEKSPLGVAVHVEKNIINKGDWRPTWTIMEGIADQKFTNENVLWSRFELRANVDGAATFQWYKDGVIVDGEDEAGYKIYLPNTEPEIEEIYGEYYCVTNAGNSRKITIEKGGSSGGTVLEQNFDDTQFPPAGWTATVNNSSNTWKLGNPADHPFTDIDANNLYSALCPWVAENQNEWLISPEFSLSDDSPELEFYAGNSTNWLSSATMKLNISTDGGSSWNKIWECENDGGNWEWRLINIDLSSYANNSSLKLAWQYIGNDGDLIGLDNIKITSGTVGINNEKILPSKFQLLQNYPNPFNPSTTIEFAIPKTGFVELTIYNLLGEKIATLISKEMNAGQHKVNFNARHLSSGIYITNIRYQENLKSQKIMLLK